VCGKIEPQAAARAYAAELRALFDAPWPRFDLVLLGLGADGHTASLFPGTTALEERQRAVAAVYVERLRAWRVTLTLPVINAARHVLFGVAGTAKAEIVQAVLEGPAGRFPAQQIRPTAGQLA
jgi:6-phosphogluconolactonase